MKIKFKVLLVVSVFIFHSLASNAQMASDSLEVYLEMSLEELLNLEVTSVSKKAERLQDVPSNIYVITSEDIRRSSAPNLMQLLRDNVPGYWALENDYKNVDAFIRNTSEGSVLVLLDGTPMQDLMLASFDYENFDIPFEQIDRIEVIKGSGGTIYGANSATGVISIYTKNARDGKKLIVSADYSNPGKTEVNILATPVNTSKFAATVYGKYSYFKGFEQMSETVNETSLVPNESDSGDTLVTNRYTGDDNTFSAVSGGLNLTYNVNARLKISSSVNLNSSYRKKYAQSYPAAKAKWLFDPNNPGSPQFAAEDSVDLRDNNLSRVVAMLRADYTFHENHSIFTRVSTNIENSAFVFGGGYQTNNQVIDVEIQDNLTLGINQFSFGGNYRNLNYNLSGFGPENTALYTKNKNNATVLGFFAQDKISLMDNKLNFYLGVKAENFSLVNDKYYFSPTAKFTVIPSSTFTIWGGFSQSYNTPGYDQTNVEYAVFRAPSPKLFYDYTYPQVAYGVYQNVYGQAISSGATPEQAAASAQAFVESEPGLTMIDQTTKDSTNKYGQIFPGHFNIAAINGPNTEPASFSNFELGFRLHPTSNLAFESSFFYSIMKNGIGNSPEAAPMPIASETRENEVLQPIYYGNYFKGTNMGLESIVKYAPSEKLMLELSHSWFEYTLEHQKNDDFDISNLTEEDKEKLKDEEYPHMPKHVFRGKIYFDPLSHLRFTVGAVYATKQHVRFGVLESTYHYESQRFDPLFTSEGNPASIGGKLDQRFILNLRVDKYFLDNKLSMYLYGSDILSKPFTEGASSIMTVYPRQVGGMYGLGLKFIFN